MTDTAPHRLTIEGMTCAHCVRAVTGAVAAVPGARDVAAELSTGRLSWRGAAVQSVRAAVELEGYTVAASTSASVSQ